MLAKIRAGIAPIFSGLVAGIIVAVYFSSTNKNESQKQTLHVPTQTTASIPPDQGIENQASENQSTEDLTLLNQAQLSSLQKQLIELKRQQEISDSKTQNNLAVDDQVKGVNHNPIENQEEAKVAELAWWDNIKNQFQQEKYDPNWAPAAVNDFQQDLSEMANETGFTLVDTDCRSIRCAVTVEFPSYVTATEKFADLLHHEYKTNCARQTLLPEPDRSLGGSPYRATFIFDCSDANKVG